MFEIVPIVAGIIAAVTVPSLVGERRRPQAFAAVSVAVAVLATIVAGEAWFFVFIDLAEVVLAIGVTLAVKDRLPVGRPSRRTVDAS